LIVDSYNFKNNFLKRIDFVLKKMFFEKPEYSLKTPNIFTNILLNDMQIQFNVEKYNINAKENIFFLCGIFEMQKCANVLIIKYFGGGGKCCFSPESSTEIWENMFEYSCIYLKNYYYNLNTKVTIFY
jgi:hypothetical protein